MVIPPQPAAGSGPLSADAIARANDLYWRSGASVNQLARELDLSKGTLYGIIAPLPAGLACPRGDGELAYPNRTARERGFVACVACGLEDEEDRVRGYVHELKREPAAEPAVAGPGLPPARAASDADLPAHLRARSLEKLLALSVLAGFAAGVLVGALLKRR